MFETLAKNLHFNFLKYICIEYSKITAWKIQFTQLRLLTQDQVHNKLIKITEYMSFQVFVFELISIIIY